MLQHTLTKVAPPAKTASPAACAICELAKDLLLGRMWEKNISADQHLQNLLSRLPSDAHLRAVAACYVLLRSVPEITRDDLLDFGVPASALISSERLLPRPGESVAVQIIRLLRDPVAARIKRTEIELSIRACASADEQERCRIYLELLR